MSFIESGHSGTVMDKIRRGLTTSHIGFVYEDICQERMWELNVNKVSCRIPAFGHKKQAACLPPDRVLHWISFL